MADKYYDLKIPFETLENLINQISDKIGYVEVSGNVLKFYDTKNTKKLLYSISLPSTINVIDSLESTSTTDALSANKGKELYEKISMTPGTMSDNHSEIFNDYFANNVYNSSYSHTEGSKNSIGIPCFEIETIDIENKTIKLTYGTLGLKTGSVVHGILQNDNVLLNIGTITSIDSENLMITIDEFLNQSSLADVQYIFIINKKGSIQNLYTGENHIGGDFSHVEGYFSCAGGYYSHAEGYRTNALGFYSHAEGRNTLALGSNSHVEGQGTRSDSSNQHVEGKNNIVDNEEKYVHIVGNGSASSTLSNAHTLDWNGNAWYQGNIKVGGTGYDDESAKEVATKDEIVGRKSVFTDGSVEFNKGMAMGGYTLAINNGNALGEYSLSINNGNAIGDYSFAGGHSSSVGDYSFSMGVNTIACGNGSSTEGNETQTGIQGYVIKSIDTTTNSVILNTLGSLEKDTLIGLYNETQSCIQNIATISKVDTTTNKITVNMKSGYDFSNYMVKSAILIDMSTWNDSGATTENTGDDYVDGYYAHAEGINTMAIGKGSHVEGINAKAIGQDAHAEGNMTEAIENHSHAEGYGSKAIGVCSHSEGISTQAIGNGSHTEGSSNEAYGDYSHAEGYGSKAYNDYSHVEGDHTIAHKSQHVQGRNNIEDTEGKYAHIVGNGTSFGDDERSNAHTLDWNGNAWYQGTVECTGIILTSPNGTKYKVTVTDSGTLTSTEQSE